MSLQELASALQQYDYEIEVLKASLPKPKPKPLAVKVEPKPEPKPEVKPKAKVEAKVERPLADLRPLPPDIPKPVANENASVDIAALRKGFAALSEAITIQANKLDAMVGVQKAILKALKAKKKLIFDEEGRPIGAEIDNA
jgi:hypothetical protein